jgi:RNA polymerase sigma-70 factor (ECF subfamily)
MLSVWRKAASFDPSRAGASTWIFTIARNLRIDYLRRDRSPADLLPDPSEEPDEAPTTEVAMINAQRDDRLREAMGSLSREQAEIVRLVYFQDRPHSEISRILGLPLGTVKSRVRLALGRLRTLLEDLK